jgi:hypothetical protein
VGVASWGGIICIFGWLMLCFLMFVWDIEVALLFLIGSLHILLLHSVRGHYTPSGMDVAFEMICVQGVLCYSYS